MPTCGTRTKQGKRIDFRGCARLLPLPGRRRPVPASHHDHEVELRREAHHVQSAGPFEDALVEGVLQALPAHLPLNVAVIAVYEIVVNDGRREMRDERCQGGVGAPAAPSRVIQHPRASERRDALLRVEAGDVGENLKDGHDDGERKIVLHVGDSNAVPKRGGSGGQVCTSGAGDAASRGRTRWE